MLVERTRAGIERAKAQGKRLWRPPSLTPEQKSDVLQLIKDGETISAIARKYKTTRQTIMRAQASKVRLETAT